MNFKNERKIKIFKWDGKIYILQITLFYIFLIVDMLIFLIRLLRDIIWIILQI